MDVLVLGHGHTLRVSGRLVFGLQLVLTVLAISMAFDPMEILSASYVAVAHVLYASYSQYKPQPAVGFDQVATACKRRFEWASPSHLPPAVASLRGWLPPETLLHLSSEVVLTHSSRIAKEALTRMRAGSCEDV